MLNDHKVLVMYIALTLGVIAFGLACVITYYTGPTALHTALLQWDVYVLSVWGTLSAYGVVYALLNDNR